MNTEAKKTIMGIKESLGEQVIAKVDQHRADVAQQERITKLVRHGLGSHHINGSLFAMLHSGWRQHKLVCKAYELLGSLESKSGDIADMLERTCGDTKTSRKTAEQIHEMCCRPFGAVTDKTSVLSIIDNIADTLRSSVVPMSEFASLVSSDDLGEIWNHWNPQQRDFRKEADRAEAHIKSIWDVCHGAKEELEIMGTAFEIGAVDNDAFISAVAECIPAMVSDIYNAFPDTPLDLHLTGVAEGCVLIDRDPIVELQRPSGDKARWWAT